MQHWHEQLKDYIQDERWTIFRRIRAIGYSEDDDMPEKRQLGAASGALHAISCFVWKFEPCVDESPQTYLNLLELIVDTVPAPEDPRERAMHEQAIVDFYQFFAGVTGARSRRLIVGR